MNGYVKRFDENIYIYIYCLKDTSKFVRKSATVLIRNLLVNKFALKNI